MKEIVNPWVGNQSGYNCFGCNPNNPQGMHMHFYWDGEAEGKVVSVWKPNENFVSWIDTLHGGIQASLLDEICGWVVFYRLQTSGVTAKMEMRYKKQVMTTWPYLLLTAELVETRHNVAIVKGRLLSPENVVCAECQCTYFTFDEKKAAGMGYIPAILGDQDISLDEAVGHIVRYKTLYPKNL